MCVVSVMSYAAAYSVIMTVVVVTSVISVQAPAKEEENNTCPHR